ncbi:hypothetical protein LCI18_001400 [Fusarium solani-melongenae]|uniref:Uncharacterized protein n=1 Tax=Fusarium solani subsp. cucurbitae TaxID=2747967 RepID=A0ACD3YNG2_FUSSC|nr:hypothetical protein LCI18_001400 [Fusarium solani-melongenae]
MSKRHRQLLPAPKAGNADVESSISGLYLTPSEDEPFKRPRIGTQLACDACRKRKIRCNGERPRCRACQQRDEATPCIYAESRAQRQQTEESEQLAKLFELMKSVSERQALDILRVIRSHDDIKDVMSIVQASHGSERHQASPERLPISTRHTRLEHELMSTNPVAFPPLRSAESDILNESSSSAVESSARFDPEETNSFDTYASLANPSHVTPPPDRRLAKLDMSFWTAVPIPNDLAAKVLLLYLETDHPLLGTFDPDLFLDDLANCRSRYCTSALVSALMYWGCQMYAAWDPEVKEYLPKFSQEAEARWLAEKTNDSLPNLAVAQLLSLAYLGHGKDHLVLEFVSEANTMATRMGLLGVDPETVASTVREMAPELQRATSYAAWGTFNWIVLMALFYQQPGLVYPEHPPRLPIPRHGSRRSPGEGVEPSRGFVQSWPNMHETFPALCRFWLIIHEVTLRYYRDQPSPRKPLNRHIGLAFAEYKYRELLAWAETLPSSLMRSERSPHHVLTLHIWFHAAILDVLRPFTTQAASSAKPLTLKTFVSQKSTPDTAYKASVDQLKRLVIVYRNTYATSTYTMLWHTALIHIANAVLDDTSDPAWRFYLSFCLQCYVTLQQPYAFTEAIGRSLLSMTLQKGHLSPTEARQMMRKFEHDLSSKPPDDIRATFMADLNLAMTDPDKASVESLADRFEDIALFQEYTNEDSSMDEPTEDEPQT